MFRDNESNNNWSIYKMDINPSKAPDCRYCIHYWCNRTDSDYRKTYYDGYWLEITEFNEDGSEESFSRLSTFKHGCKLFDILVPRNQMPSLYIYGQIGKQCPLDLGKSRENIALNKNNVSNPKIVFEEHDVDILV